jgi:hypothetical protein
VGGSGLDTSDYTAAVDAFRVSEKLATASVWSPRVLVDRETVRRLCGALERVRRAMGELIEVISARRWCSH